MATPKKNATAEKVQLWKREPGWERLGEGEEAIL